MNEWRGWVLKKKERGKKTIALKTGARGLRTILENLMLDTMYDLPSSENVAKVIVDESVVVNGTKPKIVKKEIA